MTRFMGEYRTPALSGARLVAEYIYRDERNQNYLKVERTDPKGFRQKWWFQKEWHDGKPGGRKIPYRLPELLNTAPDITVWVTEGEKDCDNVRALGLVATSASEGAGKFTSELVPWFMGRRQVIILQDNDERGREHAQQVARLLRPVVFDVRIVTFDELAEHGDVSDWLAAGGTKEALLARADAAPTFKEMIAAIPFVLPDVAAIPRREWLYAPHYIRGYLSLTLAPGGLGKSALTITEAMAMATGRPLLGVTPQRRLRVWYLNLEDPMDELHRRVAAACIHHEVTADEIAGQLFINSGRTTPLVLATDNYPSAVIDQSAVRDMISTIGSNGIDVVVIDPFVACHRLPENDNGKMDTLCRVLARIGEETQTAVMLVHHTKKLGGDRGTVEDGRGASALLAAARSARILTGMSVREAQDAEIEERERRFFFRVDHGKANLTPPAEAAAWFRMRSVDLGNESRDLDRGDSVGVATAFRYPTTEPLRVSPADMQRIFEKVGVNGPWRENPQAGAWVGHAVAQVLGLGPVDGAAKRQVSSLVKQWIAAGVLRRVMRKDERSNMRAFIEAGEIPSVESVRSQDEEE